MPVATNPAPCLDQHADAIYPQLRSALACLLVRANLTAYSLRGGHCRPWDPLKAVVRIHSDDGAQRLLFLPAADFRKQIEEYIALVPRC